MAPIKSDRISVAETAQPMVNKVPSLANMSEYTPHMKNSKEMTANDKEGTLLVAPAVVDDPAANVIAMAPPSVAKTEPSTPTHSKNSIAGSIPAKSTTDIPKTPPTLNSSFSPPTTVATNKTDPGSIIGLIISVMGITLFGTALFIRSRRQRKLRSGISNQHSAQVLASLDRNNYTDETPIRVRILAEDERNELELDEVLGDDDDVVSIGECSLEEIELEDGQHGTDGTYGEYLRNISTGFEESNVSEGSEGQFPSIFA